MTAGWPEPPKIVVLTGPAVSREAGFAPFDAAMMPAGLTLEDVVTPAGFARDPARVQDFYNRRRRQLLDGIAPTAVHHGLAALDVVRRGEVLIVTRNIDDLHERAGSRAVIHTHGELLKARCTICTRVGDRHDDITETSGCPVCGNVGHLRPHIVWVGEAPLGMPTVYEAVAQCRVFAAIGAAAHTEPAAGLLADAERAGARTIEFSPAPTPASERFDECRHGPLVETVSEWVKRLIAES